jgi:hypothetical protein
MRQRRRQRWGMSTRWRGIWGMLSRNRQQIELIAVFVDTGTYVHMQDWDRRATSASIAATVFFSLWIAAAAIQTAATVSACSQPNTPVHPQVSLSTIFREPVWSQVATRTAYQGRSYAPPLEAGRESAAAHSGTLPQAPVRSCRRCQGGRGRRRGRRGRGIFMIKIY